MPDATPADVELGLGIVGMVGQIGVFLPVIDLLVVEPTPLAVAVDGWVVVPVA